MNWRNWVLRTLRKWLLPLFREWLRQALETVPPETKLAWSTRTGISPKRIDAILKELHEFLEQSLIAIEEI